ncbi:hemolysin III family protein [Flammeovirga sp. EKP202]|uniref:PAQR family membrane homeostasis protein TrhA n=1 Tax=Flammeovirga sp. EKP202 TaxID=2770592 RepID=UPI00165EC3BA|nr:hemolysin III family protein [Flammeovirga sp. EKP202]MBD0400503.1 hemolysin III family protein [Flammeovirga sp. EKP202]
MKKLSYTSTLENDELNQASTADELEIPRDTPEEEVVNSITHGIAALLSAVGLAILLNQIDANDPKYIISAILFGGSMIILFTCSTLLHLHSDDNYTKTLVILDHSAIYWLIAGTYTPMCLIEIPHQGGTELFIVIWVIAILGTIFKMIVADRYQWVSITLYLLTGWVGVFVFPEMLEALGEGMQWIIAGGLAYTLGVPFYLWRKLRYNHAVWHIFVMVGAGLIYYGYYLYIF